MSDKRIIFLCILLFHTFFVYIGGYSSVLGRVIQAACLLLFIILFNTRYRFLFYNKNKKLIAGIICYVLAVVITSLLSIFVNTSYLKTLNVEAIKDYYEPSSYILGVMIALVVFTYFSFIEYLNIFNKTKLIGVVFFRLCLFYCVVADIVSIAAGVDNTFIAGGKFALSYLHLFLVVFYYLKNSLSNYHIRNKNYYFLILYAIVVSILSECTTALVGGLVLFFSFRYKKIFAHKIFRPKIMLYILIFCALFPLLVSSLINNSFISYIIVDILGEDLTLTGRTGIYETLAGTIILRPIWGFGIGNGHFIMSYLYGTANAQNGVANLMLEQGLVGVISVISLFWICQNEVKIRRNINTVFAVYGILLVMVVMSMVEITIDSRFIVFISFLLLKCKACQNVSNVKFLGKIRT